MTPELQVEQVPVGTLHPDPANPRRIGEAELDALCRSIEVFSESREAQVGVRCRVKVREQAAQQRLVPFPMNRVERETQQARLLRGHLEVRHRHLLETQPDRSNQALVAADDYAVRTAHNDGADEVECSLASFGPK